MLFLSPLAKPTAVSSKERKLKGDLLEKEKILSLLISPVAIPALRYVDKYYKEAKEIIKSFSNEDRKGAGDVDFSNFIEAAKREACETRKGTSSTNKQKKSKDNKQKGNKGSKDTKKNKSARVTEKKTLTENFERVDEKASVAVDDCGGDNDANDMFEDYTDARICVPNGSLCKITTPCCEGFSCNLSSFRCGPGALPSPTPAPTTSCVRKGDQCKLKEPCCGNSVCNLFTLTCADADDGNDRHVGSAKGLRSASPP